MVTLRNTKKKVQVASDERIKRRKRAAWSSAFNKHFEAAAKESGGLKDTLGSIVGKKGQRLTGIARSRTNKQLGYTESSVMPSRKQ